jgi:hypothetical protein
MYLTAMEINPGSQTIHAIRSIYMAAQNIKENLQYRIHLKNIL